MGGGSTPRPVPVPDRSDERVQKAAEEERRRLAERRGRADTILGGNVIREEEKRAKLLG